MTKGTGQPPGLYPSRTGLWRASRHSPGRRAGGFTLIELLVVVAVLTVLLAVLLPALSAARRAAKRGVCQANLRQIAQAWHIYLQDHEGRFYQGLNCNITYGGWRGTDPPYSEAHRPLNHYVASDLNDQPDAPTQAKVFRCPGDDGGESQPGTPFYDSYGTSYQTNRLLIGQSQISGWYGEPLTSEINTRLAHLNLNRVSNPSRLLLIGDFGWNTDWDPGIDVDTRDGDCHGRRYWHNLAYLDGHVAFLRIHKGLIVTDEYSVLPFQELYGMARAAQQAGSF
jgi:prepilin-type N-terminal cleavage/methylation domain-containing protein/prepilin-type processing-associated H-X9-DG protein